MKLSRRQLLPAATAASIGFIPGAGDVSPLSYGLHVHLQHRGREGWVVAVPDADQMENWVPGMAIPWVHIPIVEYIKQLDELFGYSQSS